MTSPRTDGSRTAGRAATAPGTPGRLVRVVARGWEPSVLPLCTYRDCRVLADVVFAAEPYCSRHALKHLGRMPALVFVGMGA